MPYAGVAVVGLQGSNDGQVRLLPAAFLGSERLLMQQ